MKAKMILPLLLALSVSLTAKAQFVTYGNERGSLKWSQIQTPTFRVVYPRGLDSLARVYAFTLEKMADPVAGSIGYRPNEAFRTKMPVILHPYSATANGMVTFLPRRMELLTNPEVYSTDGLLWHEELAIHESRHVSQLQFARTGWYRALNAVLGEFGPGALIALYCGPAFNEGDAVLAETSLTKAGRGRTSDFLEYMRVSFAEGQYRDWWKWRYGSQKYFTPDHYKVGYITMAGMRTVFDEPAFTKRYYERLDAHHGAAFFNFQKTVKDVSGLKFKDAFTRICESLDSTWRADAVAREPFIPSEAVTSDKRMFTEYTSLQDYGHSILAIRKGISETSSLVRIRTDGSEEKIRNFASETSRLHFCPEDGRVYWTEHSRNPRWDMDSYSDVRYLDSDGKVTRLTRGHRYFNPAPAEGRISVTEFLPDGSQRIVVLDSSTGEETEAWTAPDGLQLVETAWVDGAVYVSALNTEGFGIYRLPDFSCVLDPGHYKIKRLDSRGSLLNFTCDLNGVNELYSFDPSCGELRQLTSLRNGGCDFTFAADTLWYTVLGTGGRNIFKTPADSLLDRKTSFNEGYKHEMAEELSSGEPVAVPDTFETSISEVENYSKAGHFLKVHSWLPLYFNVDDISGLSYETIYQSAGIGATAFFQNELSSVSGLAGIHVDHRSGWRPSGHVKLKFTGLYPVFELRGDINDRLAKSTMIIVGQDGKISSKAAPIDGRPLLNGSLKTYVPLYFHSSGWNRGIIPQMTIAGSNDVMHYGETAVFAGTFSGSVRAYTMRGIPKSGIFPRLGIGAEAGYSGRPGFTEVFCSNAFAFLYGYVPGILDTHGIKLTAAAQTHVSKGFLCETYMKNTPRGFSTASSSYMSGYPLQSKFTIDYAMPLAPVDWSWLGPVAYIRNFELTLHADGAFYKSRTSPASLYSAGADLTVRLGNLLWIPYATRIGIEYEYKGGAGFETLVKNGLESSPHSLNLLFSISM